MLFDPAMAAFDAEMRARPRPRRASTRRADQLDNLSAPGAQRLCQIIKSYWDAAGFANVQTEIVHSGGSGEAPVWGVRSNLLNALPPQETRDGHGRRRRGKVGASNRRPDRKNVDG